MNQPPEILVTKASGQTEPYQREKIIASLERTGVSRQVWDDAISFVESRVYPGIKTKEILKNLKKFLHKVDQGSASRYNLKQALFQLGPSGHPFEVFIGDLFAKLGYQTMVGQVIQGKCVSHEVDVIAQKEEKHFMIECKYHNDQGTKTDVKTALYVWARFEDLLEGWREKPYHSHKFHEAWLVTNTRCTQDAYQFARCQGMRIISWDQPAGEGLRELISQTNLQPITSLVTLPPAFRRQLVDRGIVQVQKFLETDPGQLRDIPPKILSRAQEEARILLV